ncbi:MAG TPA: hypothetical protein VGH28_15570 [Polyangiaceae bacterium]
MKRMIAWLSALALACTSAAPVLDAGATDAAPADAVADAKIDAGPSCPRGPLDGTYAAPHRVIPPLSAPASPDGTKHAVTIVAITAVNEPLAPQLHAFVDALATSQWFATVGAPYALARPVQVLHIQNAPAITGSLPHTDQVAQYLAGVIQSNPLPTSGDVLYALFVPPGGDVGGADGFHGSMSRASPPLPGAFSVVARLPFTELGLSELDTTTIAMSHEIIEALTNWDQTGLQWGPPPQTDPWSASVFASLQIPDEVGDVCAGTRVREDSPLNDGGFYYQRIFSNDVATCGGGDSCVPAEDGPHYAVSAPQDWYAAQPGETITIPFTGCTCPEGSSLPKATRGTTPQMSCCAESNRRRSRDRRATRGRAPLRSRRANRDSRSLASGKIPSPVLDRFDFAHSTCASCPLIVRP